MDQLEADREEAVEEHLEEPPEEAVEVGHRVEAELAGSQVDCQAGEVLAGGAALHREAGDLVEAEAIRFRYMELGELHCQASWRC